MKTLLKKYRKTVIWAAGCIALIFIIIKVNGCSTTQSNNVISGDAAEKVYVAPGKFDEFYDFVSGGFSGQLAVYGLPSGRLFKVIPVFSVNPENGYGFTEETKPMLNTSHGFIPWDDSHHSELSQTDGVPDGKWIFLNGNNTPRVARIDLKTFRTAEIIEIPNSAGNHSSPFTTPNSDYVVAGTRFSVPVEEGKKDVSISSYKENFRGAMSFIKVDKQSGRMKVDFQIMAPPFDYDLSHAGKGPSDGWFFFSCYNTELAHTRLEAEASQNDKDYIMAINWKKVAEISGSKGIDMKTSYFHNYWDDGLQTAVSEEIKTVKTLTPKDIEGMIYYIPCPKSPHGADVDPTGEFIVAGGKLAATIPVFSFKKLMKAIDDKVFDGNVEGIPVVKYEAALEGEVAQPGLGPLHTEFDDKGNGYTSMFLSSEIVKWKVSTREILDRIPVYYSVGHLTIPGGDSRKPWGKYLVAMNKITKDRYLTTGPEITQSAQLIDISGDKMKLLLDFPTVGEPHYAQALPKDLVFPNSQKIFKLEENHNPFAVKKEDQTRVERDDNKVHIYITTMRSHFSPDNIEGVKVGDEVFFHVTNLEQDWDIPHGFVIKGMQSSEMLIMPGETCTMKWYPTKADIYPFYCTDFCSALHQEMQGYLRVSEKNSNVPITFSLGKKAQ
jgi:nitrous-oxide reductase